MVHSAVCNRWKRLLSGDGSEKGVFARILVGLGAGAPEEQTAMIEAMDLKTHRTATSLRVKKREEELAGRPVGATGSNPMGDGSMATTHFA